MYPLRRCQVVLTESIKAFFRSVPATGSCRASRLTCDRTALMYMVTLPVVPAASEEVLLFVGYTRYVAVKFATGAKTMAKQQLYLID